MEILLKISSNKLEPNFLECINIISEITDKFGIPFLLIGATARDIIFEHLHGVKSPRITMDIDIAVEVAAWNSYDLIKNELLNKYGFVATDQIQRFRHKEKEIILDVVPFGSIAKDGNLIWRENQNSMNVSALSEINKRSQIIHIENHFDLKIPATEDLIVLKLLSWNDTYPLRPRDAEDILFMIKNYERIFEIESIFDNYPDIIEKEGFDLTFTCCVILGIKIKKSSSELTFRKLVDLLEKETDENGSNELLRQMDGNIDESRNLLTKVLEGMENHNRGGDI